jgi:hypothetical protein
MLRYTLIIVTGVVLAGGLLAGEQVGVPGSETTFPTEVEARVTGRTVQMRLTGTGLRTKRGVHAYAIAAYALKGAEVAGPEDLARADIPKRLHLVMERPVDGKGLAQAFRTAVRLNHAEPAFEAEIKSLEHYMRNMSARKGEHLMMTHLPGIGLHIRVAGKVDFIIRSVGFSRAIWDIYLGEKNLGEALKIGLTSRL